METDKGSEKSSRKRKAAKAKASRPSERRPEERIAFVPGDRIIVVSQYDETLPAEFLGRRGVVVGPMPYQEIGDDPNVDPVYLVRHGPSMGRPFCTQIYWNDEIQLYRSPEVGT